MTIEHIAYVAVAVILFWLAFQVGRYWQAIQESNERIRQLDKQLNYNQGRLDAYRETIALLNERTGDDE
jgi:predicted PurR-regulated permease PerM